MDFLRRAENALERGDPAQALVLLSNGLRRHPERDDALDLLIFLYTHHFRQPGLESDLFRALEHRRDRSLLLRLIIVELEDGQRSEMARAIEDRALDRGVEIVDELPVVEEVEIVEKGAAASESDHSESDHSESGSAEMEEEIPVPVEENDSSPRHPRRRASGAGIEITTDGDTGAEQEAKPEARQKPKRESNRPRKRGVFFIALVALGVVVAGSIAIVGLQHAQDVRQLRAVDAALFALDPLEPRPVFEVIEEAQSPGTFRRSDEIGDRRRFVDALLALETGLVVEMREEPAFDEPETAWGMAGAALEATTRRDWEEAMRYSHQLDRAYGDGLPAFFVRARICEARGQWECAISRYSRVQQHFGEFLPATLGAIRIAAYRFDQESWQREKRRLGELTDDHPYGQLPWHDPFASEEDNVGLEKATGDRFLEAWAVTDEALAELQARRWDALEERCDDAPELLDEKMPAFAVTCAYGAAGRLDVEELHVRLSRLTADGGRSERLERLIQAHFPPLLTALGRADLALSISIPFDDEPIDQSELTGEEELAEEWLHSGPAHFRPPSEPPTELEGRALLMRAQALVALGATSRARRVLSPLLNREDTEEQARLEMVISYLVEGDRVSARRSIGQLEEGRIREGAKAYLAYLEGRHDEAHRFSWQPGDDPRLLRVKALAFLADGRGREGLTSLDAAGQGWDALVLVTVYQRLLARSGERTALEALREEVPDAEKLRTIDHLIDLGAASFWRRDLEQAQARLEKALEMAPDHPEVHWKLGLLRRVQGDDRLARAHFRKAWRGDQNAIHLLVESGRVHLEYGRYDQARRVFLRAVLRERQNLDAIAGLGEAYLRGDRPRGRRDLVELLGNYNRSSQDAPGRAELHRWLAILHGSRDGDEESYHFLEAASEIAGSRTSILAERGVYYEARGEWSRAREMYGQALRLDPTHPEIHLGLARVAAKMDDVDTARDHLERILTLVPVGELHQRARGELDELEDI